MYRLIGIGAVGVFAGCALFLAPVSATPIPAMLPPTGQEALVRAQFQQTRHMVPFSHPVRSLGVVVVAVNRGRLIVVFDAPYRDSWAVAEKKLWHWVEGSPQSSKPSPRKAKGTRHMAVLMAFLTGDAERVSEAFSVESNQLDQGWSLVCKPLAERMKRIVAQLTLRGNPWLESVVATTPQGDRIEVLFRDWRPVARDELTPNQLAVLDD